MKTLVILGAGPKAVAVAAKAYVLKSLGYEVPTILTVDPLGVGGNWVSGGGWTNGHHLLGTPPDKDVGFPYRTRIANESAQDNTRVDAALMEFSWMSYLVSRDKYAQWIDRGHPCPTHEEWAEYLRWVAHAVDMQVMAGRITSIRAVDKNDEDKNDADKNAEATNADDYNWGWECDVELNDGGSTVLSSDGVMITGPGPSTRRLADVPGVLSIAELWDQVENGTFPLRKRVAVIGGGESAASVVDQLAHMPCESIAIFSPSPTVYSRGESVFENSLYTDPEKWFMLSMEERQDFIRRTDRGVFSQRVQQTVKNYGHITHERGRVVDIVPRDGALDLYVSHEGVPDAVSTADVVIDARGGNPLWFRDLFPNTDSDFYAEKIVTTCSEADIAHNIGIFLQLKPHLPTPDRPTTIPAEWTLAVGKGPWLFLPTLSALAQGPGFANLSCLGEVSDRILACYIDNASADNGPADSEPGSDRQTGGEVRDEIHVG
ncbi:SidA/IucD/PvdA family monooxygenase [Corynebacterium sp.]|uniref:SidA/IucD/PvdA family monooxygenase n=1 Tax=Corynebacterium sp. TaxID=1720 RepID=UPI0026DD6AE2|nr:SidA/IucD/PvdA family monooxygenase [Corynebacterium sp.]MDO4915242.1 SidA/IucD/PvdA family monooxygenase [Corynebacterium sp.]